MFLELDASASKSPIQQSSPSRAMNRPQRREISHTFLNPEEIVRSDERLEEIPVQTADIVSKFKFFEAYKPEEKEKKVFRITPPREGVTKVR